MRLTSASVFWSFCIFLFFNGNGQPLTNRPNIVFIWFDDLGFGDAGYNGADYPTPILDELANNNAIKINFHYTENVCSASRSALLTGRYAFRTGVNAVVHLYETSGWDTSGTLYPEILDNLDYNTFIAGKWHIGYWTEELLPHNNGFSEGLYSHQGLQYYTRGYTRNVRRIDQAFGYPSAEVRRARIQAGLTPTAAIHIHDTYDISNYVETPTLMNNEEYNEDLYTEAIKDYISGLNGDNPFYIHYSQWTPHSRLVHPPEIRPDGTDIDYSVCYDAFPNRVQSNCSLVNDTRCVFCKQVHYASQNIEEIIQTIKDNQNLEWDDTIVIITSDNGAAPTASVGNGYSYGSALPLRGTKSSGYEGGIRTPAIIKGGYIERILSENEDLKNNMCEYNNMIHISDWYHIIMSILEIEAGANGYSPDSDHDELGIWNNIHCHCRGRISPRRGLDLGSRIGHGLPTPPLPLSLSSSKDESDIELNDECDNNGDDRKPRDELIMMRMCGNKNGTYNSDMNNFDPENEFFVYSAYVRKDEYKLVVRGSNMVVETCENVTDFSGIGIGEAPPFLHTYQSAGAEIVYSVPDQRYYEDIYLERRDNRGISDATFNTLYQSTCYEGMTTDQRNNLSAVEFRYNDELLYKISDDKIEACALDDETKADALREIITNRATDYTVPTVRYEVDVRALKTQLDSYDCDTDCVYTKPWNNIDSADLDEIWLSFIEKYTACNGNVSSGMAEPLRFEEPDPVTNNNDYYTPSMNIKNHYTRIFIILTGALLMIIVFITTLIKMSKSEPAKISHQIIQNEGYHSDVEMFKNAKVLDKDEADNLL